MGTQGRNLGDIASYDVSQGNDASQLNLGGPTFEQAPEQVEPVVEVPQGQPEAPTGESAASGFVGSSIAGSGILSEDAKRQDVSAVPVPGSTVTESAAPGRREVPGFDERGVIQNTANTVSAQASRSSDGRMPSQSAAPTRNQPVDTGAAQVRMPNVPVASVPATSTLATQSTAVPIIPTDANLTPGISNGRVTTAANGGGLSAQAVSSALEGGGNILQASPASPVAAGRNMQEDDQAQQDIVDDEAAEKEQDIQVGKQRTRDEMARDAILDAGSIEQPVPLNMLSRANRRFKETKKFIQEKISNQMKAKGRVGRSAFQDTIFSLKTLMPDCVSIGSDNLIESLRDPGSSILALVNRADPTLNLTREACLEDIDLLVNAINTNNIEVVFSKQPVNTKTSVQVRTLRAHYGRGIGLHPTQTKAYNADFDGDTGNLNTDQSNLRNHSRAMTHLIDAEGNPTIDPDFFPLDSLAMPNDSDRSMLLESMQERNFAWDESVASRIVDAYINACNKGDWIGLLRTIDRVAGDRELQVKHSLHRGQLASKILKNVYDYAIDRRGLNLSLEWNTITDSYEYIEPDEDTDPIVVSLIDMVDEMAHGRPAPNFQDFTLFFNKQYGDLGGKAVGGKNVPFRLLADFAKAIKRTDLITVGDPTFGINAKGEKSDGSTVTMYELWQFTCSAGVSKLISGRLHMGSHELVVSSQVKTKVLMRLARQFGGNAVPHWNMNDVEANKQLFRQWMSAFQHEYNSQMRMLNVAQVRFRGGMGIERGNTGKYDGFESFKDPAFAKAFVDVFGDYPMSRVFPDSMLGYGRDKAGDRENKNNGIILRYENMSVADFAIHNRLDWYSEGVELDENGDVVGKKKRVDEINKRFDKGMFEPMDVVMVVADRRSKQFGDYGKNWLDATEQHAGILHKIRNDISENDFDGYAYDMLELIHLMSPRMFNHFGMDSPIMFVKSKWGKRLLGASFSPDKFRSELVSMTIEYRMSGASNLLKKMNELKKEEVHDEKFADRMAAIDAHYVNELQQLASSSMAWESIVSETLGRTSAFQTLLKDKKIKRRNHEYKLDAQDFWDSHSSEDQYSLINYLKSSASYDEKMAVLCDVIKFNTGIEAIDVKHVIGMLAHNPDPLFAGSKFEMDNGIKSATDSVKDSIKKITSYKSQTPVKIRKRANKIIGEAYENKAAFEEKLFRFANDPGYYVYVDTVLAADAISSIYEKDYSDSEKIKQQTLVNGYFEAVSLQRSGGFFTHLQQTDNAVVNTVGFDQLSSLDIVRILGDPSIELHGYDEFGVPCVYSRSALCGGDTIDHVLTYLEDHPRIALACRRHMVGVDDDTEGTARLSVLDDDKAGVSHANNVFSLLNDRPRFLAITALITPTQGNVGRNLAERVNENIRNLSLFVMDEAASGKNGQQIQQDIEDFFGVVDDDSFESLIIRLRNEGAFDELEFGIDDYIAARNMFADITGEILDCVDVVKKSGIPIVSVPKGTIDRSKVKIDKSSMVAYYDARQQLNGARTAKMIGIEGSETKKNLVLREFVRNRPDRFMTVTKDMNRATILRLSELTQSDVQADLDASDDGMIVIEVPQNWNAEDLSLEHDPSKQVGSIAKFLEIKREKGAETFNAKSKKFGDDGSNSIIKFFKYGTKSMISRYGKGKAWSIEDGKDLLDQIREAGSKDEAMPILAEALMLADARLGYIDIDDVFQKSDYWNRADLMLVEYEGQVYVRTLEQLAVAFRNRLSDEAMVSEKSDVVLAELEQLNEVIGTPADPMFNNDVNVMTLDEVRVASGVGDIARIERAIRPYSSSTERNYALVWDLFAQFGKDKFGNRTYTMPPRKDIDARSNAMFAKLEDFHLRELMKGVAYPHDKWEDGEQVLNPDGSREHIYDYLGRPQDEDFELIPGPQSLVYFDQNSDMSIVEQCNKYGITAAFTSMKDVPRKYVEDAVVLEGVVILPFFDMRLNGSVSDAIAPAPGQFFFQQNNVIISDEDTTYEIAPGDATGHSTREGLDKLHFNVDGDEFFDVFDLFPNILRVSDDERFRQAEFVDERFSISIPDKEEIRRWVLSGEATIDYGIHENNPKFAREVRRYNIRMKDYVRRFDSETDEKGMLTGECHYDSIVGFVKLNIGTNTHVFAPIIPFHLEQQSRSFRQFKTTSKKPSKFKIEDFTMDNDGPVYHMRWRFTGDARDQYIKFFEGIGASNKLMIHGGDTARSRKLANGLPIDMMYSTKSVASRLFPVNKRIHTMISMLMIPRIDPNYAYNFSDLPNAFPNNPEIAEGLRAGTLTREDWSRLVKDNPNLVYYKDDKEINDIVKWLVEKCVKPGTGFQTVSPSILLSTKTDAGIMQPVGTEFEAFMDSGYNFQNALMKLMHEMCPTLVPANIEDSSKDTLFKPVKKDRTSDDYGVLQMMVPHYKTDGTEYKVAENVYISFGFFGDEFSGFKKVNFDAANRGVDDLNVSSKLNGFDLSQMMSFARAGMSSVPSMNVMEPAQDNIMKKVLDDAEEIKNPPHATRIIEGGKWGNVLALTGHRPKDLWGHNNNSNYAKVADRLKKYCIDNDVDTIISGMAQGFDQIGAQVALDLDLNLIAAIPFPGQEGAWFNKADRDRYQEILDKADLRVYVSSKAPDKDEAAQMMDDRNHWMVNNADAVYALWRSDKTHGGTWNAIKYARMKGKQIQYLDPREIEGK